MIILSHLRQALGTGWLVCVARTEVKGNYCTTQTPLPAPVPSTAKPVSSPWPLSPVPHKAPDLAWPQCSLKDFLHSLKTAFPTAHQKLLAKATQAS